MVKDLVVGNECSHIKQVIYALEHDYTLSSNPNSRKGGLVGLAATSIALGRVSSNGLLGRGGRNLCFFLLLFFLKLLS